MESLCRFSWEHTEGRSFEVSLLQRRAHRGAMAQKDILIADDAGTVAETKLAHPSPQIAQDTPTYENGLALRGCSNHKGGTFMVRGNAIPVAYLAKAVDNLIGNLVDREVLGAH